MLGSHALHFFGLYQHVSRRVNRYQNDWGFWQESNLLLASLNGESRADLFPNPHAFWRWRFTSASTMFILIPENLGA
jgi:hypothetical protein